MKTSEIRSAFLEFFEKRGHKRVPSSSLVPANDPTLLFTNSGMVQFKDALIGRENLGFTRATSAQRCVRAGGKHNDLENVGYTARHHTFFEMMGNFSFGDYFKHEAISYAWEFITTVLQLPEAKLWVTVHPSDDEARRIWIEDIGFDARRVTDLEENFWAMGDTGPCGPCSEIFYDHGESVSGGPPGSADEDGDRYVEFWNLVFPQFDRSPDGTLTPLAKPGVDTGMGLERVAAIMQGVHSNYDIDIFADLIRAIGKIAGITDAKTLRETASLRVIADHIRSSAFLIADGVIPGNEDRNYVLRRIIRRALRHGYKLDITKPFFHTLVDPLAAEMGDAYPLIREQQQHVKDVLLKEEQRFAQTLNQGMDLLEESIERLSTSTIPGEVVFRLYDTYGFPADLTADVARERGLEVDMQGFEAAMEAQRERGRAGQKFDDDINQRVIVDSAVDFSGYDRLEDQSEILALFKIAAGDVNEVDTLSEGEQGILVLDKTPFYAEAGGQVGDIGELISTRNDGVRFQVTDTRPGGSQHLHYGVVEGGNLARGETVLAKVDSDRRRRIMLNHSATHLLHAALRQTLGAHVEQRGSLVDAERLRFDFSHNTAVTPAELRKIEKTVNQEILANTPVTTELLPYDEAVKKGAMALFGEKYGDRVRVLSMGNGFSVELCGGTHVSRTGDIGLVRITSETGIAAGVRRIEAVSGGAALDFTYAHEDEREQVAQLLKAGSSDLISKAEQLLKQNRSLNRELEQLRARLAAEEGADLAESAIEVSGAQESGVKVVAAAVDLDDSKALLNTLDSLKQQLKRAVIVLGTVEGGKVSLIAGVTKDLTSHIKAGDLIQLVAGPVGARGGGRPDMARAGGGDKPDALPEALGAVPGWVREHL